MILVAIYIINLVLCYIGIRKMRQEYLNTIYKIRKAVWIIDKNLPLDMTECNLSHQLIGYLKIYIEQIIRSELIKRRF